jgi:hypothetical protein
MFILALDQLDVRELIALGVPDAAVVPEWRGGEDALLIRVEGAAARGRVPEGLLYLFAGVIRDALTGMGATESDLARIRIPVGLHIGARTPSEIALSVLAELVSIRSGVASEAAR